jgi:hypothetical protein
MRETRYPNANNGQQSFDGLVIRSFLPTLISMYAHDVSPSSRIFITDEHACSLFLAYHCQSGMYEGET